MSWGPFVGEYQLALKYLESRVHSTQGRVSASLKTQVQALGKMQKLIRRGFTTQSDYKRITDESYVTVLLSTSVWLPANNTVVAEFAPRLMSSPDVRAKLAKTRSELVDAVTRGQELRGVLVENHYIGLLWEPEYTGGEKLLVGLIELVKLGAAIASTVTTLGAAAPALITTGLSAISTIGDLVTSVRSARDTLDTITSLSNTLGSVKETATKIAESVTETFKQAETVQETLTSNKTASTITTRQSVSFQTSTGHSATSALNLQTKGIDTSLLVFDTKKIEQARQDAEKLKKMVFLCVQRLTPMRVVPKSGTRSQVVMSDNKGFRDASVKMTLDIQACGFSVLRIGESTREQVGVASSASKSAEVAENQRLLMPWANTGNWEKSGFFDEALILNMGSSNAPNWDASGDKTPVPMWDGDDKTWISFKQLEQTVAIPKATTDDRFKALQAVALKPLVAIHKRNADKVRAVKMAQEGVHKLVSNINADKLALARKMASASEGVQKRVVAKAAAFKSSTYRGILATRHPMVKAIDALLEKNDSLGWDEIDTRTDTLKSIKSCVGEYKVAKPMSSKSDVLDDLVRNVDSELKAIEAWFNIQQALRLRDNRS